MVLKLFTPAATQICDIFVMLSKNMCRATKAKVDSTSFNVEELLLLAINQKDKTVGIPRLN